MVGGNCIYLRVLQLTPMMLVGVAITVCLCSPQRVHGFETSFGSFGTGPGQFKGPCGLAVNSGVVRVCM